MFLSFAILSAPGITFNVMVLFALVLALGMLVDNGIVVVENIYRLMDEGMSPFDAARYGVGEVAGPSSPPPPPPSPPSCRWPSGRASSASSCSTCRSR